MQGVVSGGKITGIEIQRDGKEVFELMEPPANAVPGDRVVLKNSLIAQPDSVVSLLQVEDIYKVLVFE